MLKSIFSAILFTPSVAVDCNSFAYGMPVSEIRLSIPQSLNNPSTISLLLLGSFEYDWAVPPKTTKSVLIFKSSNLTQTITFVPSGFHSTLPFPSQVSAFFPAFISSIVSRYSPIDIVFPLSSSAFAVVGVSLSISTIFEHWKYFFVSASTNAKSTTLRES